MFYHDSKLQYTVRVDKPDPVFAKMLQQAIGGVQGEIRVCLQYLFQAWGARGPVKYRDMLLETGTEEMAHVELLSTAVAMNLEGAPTEMQEEAAKNPVVEAVMGGMNPNHVLSAGLAAMPVDANGNPFDCSHIYASGNILADMMANVTAESTGRILACRLHNMTEDKGMKDMLAFLIARDRMHQNQFMAAVEDLGGKEAMPIPDDFPRENEPEEFGYAFLGTNRDPKAPMPQGRWSSGPSIDGKGEFTSRPAEPKGQVPSLGKAKPGSGAQKIQE